VNSDVVGSENFGQFMESRRTSHILCINRLGSREPMMLACLVLGMFVRWHLSGYMLQSFETVELSGLEVIINGLRETSLLKGQYATEGKQISMT